MVRLLAQWEIHIVSKSQGGFLTRILVNSRRGSQCALAEYLGSTRHLHEALCPCSYMLLFFLLAVLLKALKMLLKKVECDTDNFILIAFRLICI